jgi:hypothetical protein
LEQQQQQQQQAQQKQSADLLAQLQLARQHAAAAAAAKEQAAAELDSLRRHAEGLEAQRQRLEQQRVPGPADDEPAMPSGKHAQQQQEVPQSGLADGRGNAAASGQLIPPPTPTPSPPPLTRDQLHLMHAFVLSHEPKSTSVAACGDAGSTSTAVDRTLALLDELEQSKKQALLLDGSAIICSSCKVSPGLYGYCKDPDTEDGHSVR